MAEEEKKAEEKAEPKKADAVKEVKPQEQKEKTAPGEKKKKINRLSLKELEKKIKQTEEKMGSLNSSYAQQLLKRKEQLLAETRSQNTACPGGGNQQASETLTEKKQEAKEPGGENAADL